MILYLFGPVRTRWVDAYFPFTNPSLELELDFSTRDFNPENKNNLENILGSSDNTVNPQWTEMLGCGIIRQEILDACNFYIL